MGNDIIGNYFYDQFGDSSIVCDENGNLFVRVYNRSGGYRDYYTTKAGTREGWLARQNGNPRFVPHADMSAYTRADADTANANSEQSANGGADENGDVWYDREWRIVAAENPGWTKQQVTDEMTRRIYEADWNAGYQKLITDIANSGSPAEREQKVIAHMSELNAYWDSGIHVDNDLKYLRNMLSNTPPSPGLLHVIAPNNPAFIDATLSAEEYDIGYRLEENPNGILWRVKAGVPHLEDYYKFEEQQKVLLGIIRAMTPSESLISDTMEVVPYIPLVSTVNSSTIWITGTDLAGRIASPGERQNAGQNTFMDLALLGIGGPELKLSQLAKEPSNALKSGEFNILNWKEYPKNLPKPEGPFRLLKDVEYNEARKAANKANRAIHDSDPSLDGMQIHEIQPIKFGGDPIDPLNKIPLTRAEHIEVTTWWRRIQKQFEEDLLKQMENLPKEP